MSLRSLLEHPPAEYSPLAFWFWNGDLAARDVLRQASEMHARGMRGFFMHARGGLVRPAYLSTQWMRLVRAVVENAERRGGKAWLYDEMGWPSGMAGGRVPRLGARFQQQYVECLPIAGAGGAGRIEAEREIVAVFRARAFPPRSARDLALIGRAEAVGLKNERLLVFAVRRVESYIDTLRREPLEAFIRFTHEAYRREIGRHFGKTVPGIFTDEPSHRAYRLRERVLTAPWTERLPQEFEERSGYPLRERLPSLFWDVGDFQQVRRDFWVTVSDLFSENYGGTLYEWCGRNRLSFTGHYEYEVPLHLQVQCLSAAMPLYLRMQVPGLDLLGRNRPRYERRESIVLVKQPASVANQTGRKRVLCEAFGTGGWDFGPERAKWQADWLFALGVNMLCLHGMYYSIAGRRKYDAPPDFLRLPWWEISKPLHDHYARVSFILSQGRPRRDVLVIHPQHAAWARHRPQDHIGICDREDSALGRAFGALLEALVERHLDFDLGDEGALRQARVSGGEIVLGKARYRVAIVPPLMHRIEPETAALLNRMADAGGTVISLSRPQAFGGKGSALGSGVRLVAAAPAAQRIRKAAAAAGGALGARTMLSGRGAEAIALQERDLPGGARAIFLTNSSLDDVRATLTVPGCWGIEECDTATGETHHGRGAAANGQSKAVLEFAPAESHLLMLTPLKRAAGRAPRAARASVLLELDDWRVEPRAPNLLTFDYCRVRKEKGGSWNAPVAVLKTAQMKRRALRFEFVNALPGGAAGQVLLAYEGGKAVRVVANGKALKPCKADLPRFLDCCGAVDMAAVLKPGRNIVDLEAVSGEPPAQHAYLLGEFSVKQAGKALFALEPQQPRAGPWHECGFPFFAGPMSYSCSFTLERLPAGQMTLEIDSLREAAEVFVNRDKAGELLWRPWRLDITRLLRPGRNSVRLVVHGNLRNAFGPWHFPGDERCAGFSQEHWTGGHGWTDRYLFVPLGLLGAARLVARREGA